MLSQLIQRKDVRGCLAMTSPDMRVVWSEGIALDSSEKLSRMVRFVQDMLNVSRQHVEEIEQGDEANLLRIRTKKYELIITPSRYPCLTLGQKYVLVVLHETTS